MDIDARVSALSEDGQHNLDFEYRGKIHVTSRMENVLKQGSVSGAHTEWLDDYYFVQMRLHSRSELWAWVNGAVFLAPGKLELSHDGRRKTCTVRYKIFQVENQ